MLSKNQQNFYDITIKNNKIKQAISSKDEFPFKKILNAVGAENKDWFHQMAFVCEEDGLVAVCDFAFPDAKLIIELDGQSHKAKKQLKRDIERDKVFNANDYIVLRIKTPIQKDKENYWKAYIKEFYKICLDEVKKSNNKKRTKKKRLFTKEEFEKVFKNKLITI